MQNAVWSSVNTNRKENIQQILILSKKIVKGIVFIWGDSICDLLSLLNFSLYGNVIRNHSGFHALYLLSAGLEVSRFPVPVYLSINADRGRQGKEWIFIILGEYNNVIGESVCRQFLSDRIWGLAGAVLMCHTLSYGYFYGGKLRKGWYFLFHIVAFCHSHM